MLNQLKFYICSGSKKAGFTLIELLAVVLILGILTTIALPQYQRSMERARAAEAPTMLKALYDSRERVALEKGFDSYNVMPTKFGFTKLDIAAKGKLANGAASTGTLTTKDMEYKLVGSGGEGNLVSAKLLKGNNAGTFIEYNGSVFSCKNTTLPKACATLGY